MTEERKGREGNRWYNARPTGEEVADWFKSEVQLHDDMDAAHYVGGVVMIQQTEKSKELVEFRDGRPIFDERENLVHTPYIKVETRVAYFWDWLAKNPEWVGVIEPVEIPPFGGAQLHGPPGFFLFDVHKRDQVSRFLGCSMRVGIWEREGLEVRDGKIVGGKPVIMPSAGTRIVPVLNNYGADENVYMKAETGAVGRALGMAGILVVPGSGIASGEDMQENGKAGTTEATALPPVAEAPETGVAVAPVQEAPETHAEQAQALWQTLIALNNPEAKKEFETWARGRGSHIKGMGDIVADPQLAKQAVRRLEGILDRLESQEPGTEVTGDDAFGG